MKASGRSPLSQMALNDAVTSRASSQFMQAGRKRQGRRAWPEANFVRTLEAVAVGFPFVPALEGTSIFLRVSVFNLAECKFMSSECPLRRSQSNQARPCPLPRSRPGHSAILWRTRREAPAPASRMSFSFASVTDLAATCAFFVLGSPCRALLLSAVRSLRTLWLLAKQEKCKLYQIKTGRLKALFCLTK